MGTLSSTGFLNYDGLLVKFQRRYANGFSFMNSYTYGQAIDLNSDNDGGVTLINVYDPGIQPRARPTTTSSTRSSRTSCTALPFAKENKLLGGWQLGGILYARTGRALTITQTQGVLSTGTNTGQQQPNRPNRLADNINNPDQNIDHWFDPAAFQIVPETTATYGSAGRNIARGPGYFNIDANIVKHTQVREVRARAARRGLQRAQPPGVRRPQHDVRHRRLRDDHGHAGQPVLRAVRHDRAADPVVDEAPVLDGLT